MWYGWDVAHVLGWVLRISTVGGLAAIVPVTTRVAGSMVAVEAGLVLSGRWWSLRLDRQRPGRDAC